MHTLFYELRRLFVLRRVSRRFYCPGGLPDKHFNSKKDGSDCIIVLSHLSVGFYSFLPTQVPKKLFIKGSAEPLLTYPANFNATNRSVELSGAAYFDVSPDEKHRFEVKVGNCSVVVKGTKFDVTAYPDDSLITTTLLEGAVGFTAPRGETSLRPGESLTYDRFAETTAITHVNTAQYLAWIEGRIEFIDVTIVQLCESLSSLYGVEITLDDRLRADGTFITIRLSNQESLDSVLKALDLIVPVSVHRQGPSVRLSAK